MELQEVLWDLLSEAKCPDGFAEPNNNELATHVAPIIEKALRAAYDKGDEDGRQGVTLYRDDCSDNGVTAGVAAMVEER